MNELSPLIEFLGGAFVVVGITIAIITLIEDLWD